MLATRPAYLFSRYLDHRTFARNCLKVLLVVAMISASLFAMPIRSQAAENAHFNVDVEGNGVWGHDWSPGEVQVSITGGSSWTVQVSDGSDGQSPGDFSIDLNNAGPTWDIVSGNEITVDHTTAAELKTHAVTELTAGYDTDSIVGGTAVAGSVVLVWVHESDAWRNETATGGNWSANFADAGDETGEEHIIVLGPGNNGAAHQCDGDNDCTFAFWGVPELPSFSVRIDEGQVHGYNWPLGADVTLDIDDPGNGSGIDYTETLTPEPAPWDPDQTFIEFNTAGGGFSLSAGQFVSMSNGDVTKTHTVTDLTVVDVDAAADTVSGTTTSGFGSVNVNIHHESGQYRSVVVVAGEWSADFSIPSDDHEAWDIAPGTNGEANEGDDDGDSTQRSWGIANPAISVETSFSVWSTGDGWIEGNTASLSVDDGSGGDPEYTDSVLVEWQGPEMGPGFNFHTEPFEIQPGFVVTVTDGVTTKVLDVADVTVDVVDADADFIAGTAPDETWVHVNAGNDWDGCGLEVFSELDGSWVADFSSGECTLDLGPGFGGSAQVFDDDGDSTHRGWRIQNPTFSVGVDEEPQQLWGNDWVPGDSIDVTIDGSVFPGVAVVNGGEDEGSFGFDVFAATATVIVPGDEITVTDESGNSKSHVVTGLTAAHDTDSVVGGEAADGSDVDVWVHDSDVWRHEVATTGDVWSTDFATPGGEDGEEATIDLGPGNNGGAAQCDDDGDCTNAQWGIPNPAFSVETSFSVWSTGDGWIEGNIATLSIDDGSGGAAEYTDTVLIEWQGPEMGPGFNFHTEPFEIQPGFVVTVTDGVTTKVLDVADVTVDVVDADADFIAGTAPGETWLNVNAGNDWDWCDLEVFSAPDGSWAADFSGDPCHMDLAPGTNGAAQVYDDDNDSTHRGWGIANPVFNVGVNEDPQQLWGHEWVPGDSIDVTINGSEFPGVAVVDEGFEESGNFWFDVFDATGQVIVPGDEIIIADESGNSKTHTVTALTAAYDTDSVVIGTAEADSDVDVWVHDTDVGRHEVATGGVWSTDFSVEGDEEGEESTIDLGPGDNGAAAQCDDDGDCTFAQWRIANPNFTVSSEWDGVWGDEWVPGASVTVEVFEFDKVTSKSGPVVVLTDEWGQFGLGLGSEDPPVDVIPGDYVTVTQRTTVKDHIVIDLLVDVVDAGTDVVSGSTNVPFVAGRYYMGVWIHDGPWSPVTPDAGDGSWSVDFAAEHGYDIQEGEQGGVSQPDDDGDRTNVNWEAVNVPVSNTSLPSVSGVAKVGETLTGDDGSWSGTAPIGYAYKWLRCNSGGASCSTITGATTTSYGPVAADVGSTIVFEVEASNVVNSLVKQSAATAVVQAADVPVSNTSLPSVSGVAKVGETLTGDDGSWSGTAPIAYEYQWLRCNSGGASCSTITGATTASYGPVAADVGSTIVFEVTATNVVNSLTEQSAATAVVQAADVPVSNTSLPSVSGVAKVGETLTGDDGSWSGTAPITYAYKWLRCNTGGASCSTITGATTASYVPVSADVGSTIRFKVTATNVVNSLTEQSAATAVVQAADVPVSNTSLPSVSGVAKVGETLTGDDGSWAGTAPITYAYKWLRCNTGGASCSTITGATTASYVPVSADVGSAIRFEVTATNVVNSLTEQSAATAVVKAADVPASPFKDTVGLVDPGSGVWRLRDGAGVVSQFYYGNPGDYPFMGDWDCDGIDTPGLYRQSDGFAYLRNSNTVGVADVSFFFGNPGDVPIAGDFNNDGCDTLSIYRPANQRFYVINELGKDGGGLGAADYDLLFGNPGDSPVVGDWDGDGVDEIGLYRESSGFFYYRNTLSTGVADGEFFFGDPGDRFVAGDWGIVDGRETPGLFRPSNVTFFFRHTLTQGNADSQFTWTGADASWLPVAGNFGLD